VLFVEKGCARLGGREICVLCRKKCVGGLDCIPEKNAGGQHCGGLT